MHPQITSNPRPMQQIVATTFQILRPILPLRTIPGSLPQARPATELLALPPVTIVGTLLSIPLLITPAERPNKQRRDTG